MEKFDVVIIGAGIIGLASARALIISNPSLKILVCEKEASAGKHASGRNSGVLHAGFYYSPESLKAQFCREGNRKLRNFIKNKGIPLSEIGKVVITQSENEEERLDTLYQRGLDNGVQLALLPKAKLEDFEPLARTFQNFLWSPTTAVSDPASITNALVEDLISLGVEFRFSMPILNAGDGLASFPSCSIKYKHLLNSAGTQADRIAHMFHVGEEFSMLPFMGMYRYVDGQKLPLKTLVYPVPHPINPFLGVHFTLTFDGYIKIGPTAIPTIGREQYKINNGFSFPDMKSTFQAGLALALGVHHSTTQIAKSEFPKYSSRYLVGEAAKLVPAAGLIRRWKVKPPGIRAQLVNLNTGELVQDFIVEKAQQSTHILNAVSPGWTSALSFGEFVSTQVLEEL
jgi:L-2-hydroxyglutarate oxidase LhgO